MATTDKAMTDDDKIVKPVLLEAPITHVWEALTDYKKFGEWFHVDLDQPFKAGAESTGHITYPGHEGVVWFAIVERLEKNKLFSFRWYDSDDPRKANERGEPALSVEFALQEKASDTGETLLTELIITESGFSSLSDARRSKLRQGNIEGWNIQADNLARFLSTLT